MSRDILLNHIDAAPEQPRKHFDQASLDELAQSMAANGLAVPILVRPVGDRYIIVHGERRWRAAQQLGWPSIPAEVRELSAEEAHWLSLIENIQRADLSPIEEARAYQAYLATGITQAALGQRIGKTPKSCAYLRCLIRWLCFLTRRRLQKGTRDNCSAFAACMAIPSHGSVILNTSQIQTTILYLQTYGLCP
jgi:ParB/RepB/Spo0J family partition protein